MDKYGEEPGSVRAAFADLFGAENGQNYLRALWDMGFAVIRRPVNTEHQQQLAVQKQIDDWARCAGAAGISGSVRVLEPTPEGMEIVSSRKIGEAPRKIGLGMTRISAREHQAEYDALIARGFDPWDAETPLLAIQIVKGRKLHQEYERTHR